MGVNDGKVNLSDLVRPTPKQREFLQAIQQYWFVLFGGAAGGGKSFILQWWSVICVLKAFTVHGVRNTKFLLACEDYPALEGRHLSAWRIPRWMGEIKNSSMEGLRFKLVDSLGGGMVMLRNLDDPGKYDSEEFIGIAVDEWTKNPWKVFDELRKRLRWPAMADTPHLPCGGHLADKIGALVECPIPAHHGAAAWNFPFAMGSNPGGPSHSQTKEIFVDGDFRNFPELAPIKEHFHFVRSRSTDNPYNPADYKEKNLDTLPEQMRLAYAEGDWNVFVGQYFSNFIKAERRIHPSQAAELIKPWWTRWMSSDWGFHHHWVTQWHATGLCMPEDARRILGRIWEHPKKIVVTYRELAARGLADRAYAEQIVQLMPRDGAGRVTEQILDFFFSPDGFGRRGESGHSTSQELSEVFHPVGLPFPVPADDNRVQGWRVIYGLVARDECFISSECDVLLNALPVLKHREDKPEDVEKVDHISDDSADCYRYGCKSMLEPSVKPIEVERQEITSGTLQRTGDMSEVHLANMRFEVEAQKRQQPLRPPARFRH
jgi:hypothetical protein